MTTDLRYPVGPLDITVPITSGMRDAGIAVIAALPARMRAATVDLTEAQLDTPYRPGGWTVRQVVHHVADSHMNAYIRLKLGLTEDVPTIKPYDQDAWSELCDMRLPIEVSLVLLDSLHERWTPLWRALTPDQFGKTFNHPELGRLTLDTHLQIYAWHSRHHVAHVTALRARQGW